MGPREGARPSPRLDHLDLDLADPGEPSNDLWLDVLERRNLQQGCGEWIFDLKEENVFRPRASAAGGHAGPYHLRLSVNDGRLVLEIADESGAHLETLVLGLGRFRRPIREYFAICDSYYQAIRKATASEIETIDMARRGVHNEAAELLLERFDGKVETDFATARRLFTLICVLHIRG